MNTRTLTLYTCTLPLNIRTLTKDVGVHTVIQMHGGRVLLALGSQPTEAATRSHLALLSIPPDLGARRSTSDHPAVSGGQILGVG